MGKKINISEIARIAGVSKATVSYVINDVGRVSNKTKEKVKKIMTELDYIPNVNARALSIGQTKLIGVTLPLIAPSDTTGSHLETNPFFAEYLGEIHKVISSYGYDILLSGIQAKGEYKDWIKSRGLAGIILLGTYPHDIYEEVKELNIPAVLTDVYESYSKDFHSINTDDAEGSYQATRHLIELGHKNRFCRRIDYKIPGSRQPLSRLLPGDAGGRASNQSDRVFETQTTFAGGIKIAQRLIKDGMDITALAVDADIVALGIMKTFQDSGRKIPDELSIVGFDDIQASSFTSPGLTTIRQFISKKGEIAARAIMKDILSNKRTAESQTVKCKLIVRGSTKGV